MTWLTRVCVCVCRIVRHPRNQIIRISTSEPANQIEICQYCVRLLFINLLCISCACGLVDRFYCLIARLLVRRFLLPFIFIKFRCAFRVTIHVSRIPFSFVYRFNFWSFKSQTHTPNLLVCNDLWPCAPFFIRTPVNFLVITKFKLCDKL